ncbi:MAG TPA: dihydroorotase [Ktedonobacterales bacterium]|nr:dihydroorotase [Ktedonobacterales bacterium]
MRELREHGPLHLRGARLLDPSQDLDSPGAVLIAGGRVVAIGAFEEVAAVANALAARGHPAGTLDLPAGSVLAPGFVDLHAHLREPGDEAKETIQTGTAAAARGGFTTLCCMPNTHPVLDSRAALELVRIAAQDTCARVLPIAAITVGEAGTALSEMVELAEAGAVAFSDDGRPVSNASLMRAALSYSLLVDRPIVEHCQDESLVGSGVMHEGTISALLGLPGWPAIGEETILARDIALARVTGARYHAAHLSTAGSVALIRAAKAEGLRVSAEVTPHHLLLTDTWVAGERTGPLADALAALDLAAGPGERYDTNTKVNPPLRTASDAAALLAGLLDGTIDAIATDHAPHTWADKACEYGEAAFGISGLETALAALLTLVHSGHLPLASLIAALTSGPARAFGLPFGTLAIGAPADIVIFDPNEQWTVDPTQFASKGRNTPLAGLTLRGRVRMTLLGGQVVYDATHPSGD